MAEVISEAVVLEAMQANLTGHFSSLHRATTGMTVWERPGLLTACSGLPCDTFNVLFVRGPTDARDLGEAIALFRSAGLPFAVWSGPNAACGSLLAEAGLRTCEMEIGMVLTPDQFRPSALPAGLTVERVANCEQLNQFAQIVAANWDPPDPSVLRFYNLTQPAILTDGCSAHLFVGYSNGLPVAAAEAFLSDTAGGIYSVATLAAHRRRGIGAALTSIAVEDAFRTGRPLASLQASSDGRGIYARMGFRPICAFTVFQ